MSQPLTKKSSMLLRARMLAGKRIAKKYRGIHAKTLQRMEYKRLRDLVPWLRQKARDKKKISKVEVIENTIIYIDQLHKALAEKIQRQQAESLESSVSASEAGEMARMAFNEEYRHEKIPSASMSMFSSSSLSSSLPTSLSSSSLPSSSLSPPLPSESSSSLPPPSSSVSSSHPQRTSQSNFCIKERHLPSYIVQSNILYEMSNSYQSHSS